MHIDTLFFCLKMKNAKKKKKKCSTRKLAITCCGSKCSSLAFSPAETSSMNTLLHSMIKNKGTKWAILSSSTYFSLLFSPYTAKASLSPSPPPPRRPSKAESLEVHQLSYLLYRLRRQQSQ